MISRRQVIATSVAGLGLASKAESRSAELLYSVTSPDGRAVLTLRMGQPPEWAVRYDGKPILLSSQLSLWLAEEKLLGADARLLSVDRQTHRGGWSPPFGVSDTYSDNHNELILHLKDGPIHFDIIARAYDSGVAVRYRLVTANGAKGVELMGERTQFCFPEGSILYSSRDEGEYQVSRQANMAPLVHPELTASSDKGDFADVPVTIDAQNGVYALLIESDRLHYPRLMLKSQVSNGRAGLMSYLMRYPGRATGWGGPGDTPEEAEFDIDIGQETPWRVLLLADSPARLIEQGPLIPTLATPNRLGDVSWVKPGRAIRIRQPYSTAKSLEVVDFAEMHRFEYVEYDAHWYGDGTDASDPTRPIAELDLPRIIAYAREKGIGMILYIDRIAVTRALDAMCRLYRDWGVAGVKLGFMWEGRQSDNDFIFNVVKAFGEHGMIVNLHDDLRPAGLERTLPNYLALEGVRGNEQFPPARHNVILAYTRAIAGPIDYTICYANEKNQTTNAHQLALAAIYYNPLTFLYWYDTPDKYLDKSDPRYPWPELAWFDACPTTWDESHALAGEIENYVVVARRHGKRWFLGALTNENSRHVKIGLGFLGKGKWTAQVFRDGELTHPTYLTPVVMETRQVDATLTLTLDLNAAGGQAILFTPEEA